MATIRAIIIDDEEDARITLRALLKACCPEVEVIAEKASVKDGISAIRSKNPDLVFLDVRLSPGSGFDILHAIDSIDFHVIFITAYDEYAIRAIRFSALDYLLKPVDVDDLQAAIAKISERERPSTESLQMNVFRENIREQFGRMVIPTLEGFVVIHLKDVLRCEADRNYTHVFLKDGRKLTASRSLKAYEEMLTPNGFQRVHQSHMVNLSAVTEYKRRKKGGIALLESGEEVPVSEQRKEAFLQAFM